MTPKPEAVAEAWGPSPEALDPVGDGGCDLYDRIAEYYDVLYAEKDYASECRFFHRVFRKCRRPVRRLLDLGCGTGAHAGILGGGGPSAPDPLLVTGVDRSVPMLERARRKFPHLDFRLGDLLTYRATERYDAAIAMFGVLGHIRGQDMHRAFLTANYHLETRGLFVFDGWHRPAVMRGQRPRGKLNHYEAGGPAPFPLFKYVEMYYCPEEDVGNAEYVVIDLEHRKVIRDRHKVSLLSLERVEDLCRTTGFALLSYARQCELARLPGVSDWKFTAVLEKVADVQGA
jgi:SAM-dependent methyltransferase